MGKAHERFALQYSSVFLHDSATQDEGGSRSDMGNDMAWRERAACLGVDVCLFFPERGDMAGVATAKRICASCPVCKECGHWALRHERIGIWGGLSGKERASLRRKLNIEFVSIAIDVGRGDLAERSPKCGR